MASPLEYAKTTYDALIKHGKVTQISSFVDSYNPTTGVNTRGESQYTTQTSPLINYEDKYIDGDLILRGDAKLIFANYNIGFVPAPGMKVDTIWTAIAVIPYNYQDSTVAYEIQLRKT